jgi:antitoxin Phd
MKKTSPKRLSRQRSRVPARHWQLQKAKAQFSELFRRARSEGPQLVTRQDKEAVVVLPAEEFERLRTRSRQPQSLVRFFAESPLAKVRINWKRERDSGRPVAL